MQSSHWGAWHMNTFITCDHATHLYGRLSLQSLHIIMSLPSHKISETGRTLKDLLQGSCDSLIHGPCKDTCAELFVKLLSPTCLQQVIPINACQVLHCHGILMQRERLQGGAASEDGWRDLADTILVSCQHFKISEPAQQLGQLLRRADIRPQNSMPCMLHIAPSPDMSTQGRLLQSCAVSVSLHSASSHDMQQETQRSGSAFAGQQVALPL